MPILIQGYVNTAIPLVTLVLEILKTSVLLVLVTTTILEELVYYNALMNYTLE